MMKHEIKPCDNLCQDQWAKLYLQLSTALITSFGIDGKATVREGVRIFASHVASHRKEELLAAGCKTNLETFFADGFGFPCGDRCHKEWIRHTEQELFINIISCPYALWWNGKNHEIGRMFCEEYYPVLVHTGTSEKAQIDLGYCMLNGRNNTCRLSLYLRPANVPEAKRAECFPEFDMIQNAKAEVPPYTPDYDVLKKDIITSFIAASQKFISDGNGEKLILESVKKYVADNHDESIGKCLGDFS